MRIHCPFSVAKGALVQEVFAQLGYRQMRPNQFEVASWLVRSFALHRTLASASRLARSRARHCSGAAAHEAPEGFAPAAAAAAASETTTATPTIDAGAGTVGDGGPGRRLGCAAEVLPCPPSLHLLPDRRVGRRRRGLPVQELLGHRRPAGQQDHGNPSRRLCPWRRGQAEGGGCHCKQQQ